MNILPFTIAPSPEMDVWRSWAHDKYRSIEDNYQIHAIAAWDIDTPMNLLTIIQCQWDIGNQPIFYIFDRIDGECDPQYESFTQALATLLWWEGGTL